MGADILEAARLTAAGGLVAYAPQPGPQTALLCCPISDVLFGGARGGGKTYALLGDFLQHAMLFGKGAKGVLFRRTYDELDEVKVQAQEIYPHVDADWKESKSTWFFANGASLKLRYLKRDEDASHYQGHQYTWIGVDEAGNFPSPDPIDKLRATLRSKLGVPTFLRLTANPGGPGHGWLKQRYIEPAPPMVPHACASTGIVRVFIPSRLSDNAILVGNDATYEQRIRGSGPAWLVLAWLNGDWNATPEGGVWKSVWFKRYGTAPANGQIVLSLDTAYKPQQINDPSVCTVWKVTDTGYYLLDVWRDRVDYPTLKRTVENLAAKWQPHAVLIEDKASGQSLIQELRAKTRLPVIAIEPDGDKVTRALDVATTFEAGLVFFPEVATWLIDYEIELTIFPLAPHDDQVDSTSQFLRWVRSWTGRIESFGAGLTRTQTEGMFKARETGGGFGSIRRSESTEGF